MYQLNYKNINAKVPHYPDTYVEYLIYRVYYLTLFQRKNNSLNPVLQKLYCPY